MKSKIQSLQLSLFKGFKNTKINFSSGLNLLVGGNNSGKSSILQAVYLAFYFLNLTNGISEVDVKRGGARRSQGHRLRGITVKSLPLPFHEEAYLSEGLKKRSIREQSTKIGITTDKSIDFLETITFPGGNLLIISSDAHGQSGNQDYQKKVKAIINEVNSSPLFIPSFSGISIKEEVKMNEVVRHYLATGRSNEVLRNQLSSISKNRPKLKKLNFYLKNSFGVEIVSNNTKEIYLSSLYKDSEYDNLDISSAGSGFQQILQILVYIVTSNTDVILIDEPDAHLHHKLQNGLYDILSDMIAEGKQIIVATHSKVFIDRAVRGNDHLIPVNKTLEEQKAIQQYSDGLKILYKEGLIDEDDVTKGGNLNLIDIEDSEIGFDIVKMWLAKLNFKEPQYKIVSAGDSVLGYIATKERIDNVNVKSLILRDSDSLSNEHLNTIESALSKNKQVFYYWRCHEIENFLLKDGVIARVLKNKGVKGVTPSKIKKTIELIVKEQENDLFDGLDGALDGKLKKYYRELSINFADISILNRVRRKEIREGLSYPFKNLPGKKMFNFLKQKIHNQYKVSISEFEIAQNFKLKDIPAELVQSLRIFE